MAWSVHISLILYCVKLHNIVLLTTNCFQLKIKQMSIELQLQPFNVLLRRTLAQLEEKDPVMIFAYPVTEKEVSNCIDNFVSQILTSLLYLGPWKHLSF